MTRAADEDRLRRSISTTLRVGTALAVACIAVGIAVGVISGTGLDVDESRGPVTALLEAKPGSIVLLGVLLLTLTPVAQLVAAVAAFGRDGERRYLGIALVVLALLVASLAFAVTAAWT